MPLIQVHLLEGRSVEQKRALLRAITDAVHTSLDVPVERIRVWLNEMPGDHFIAGGVIASERLAAAEGAASG